MQLKHSIFELFSQVQMSLHQTIRETILSWVDFFYPIFKKWMPLQTFRYAACGGANTAFDIFIYFLAYNFLLKKQLVDLGFVAISPHIFSFIIAFAISFPTGFYLSRYVVWQETTARKSKQLFRYFLVVVACIGLNYGLLKLFVETLGWYPTPSKILSTPIVVLFSYFAQRNFSFKKN